MRNVNPVLLAPSILGGDHAALAESLREVEAAGQEWLHIDIMDGHFVPNFSFGPQTVRALRRRSRLFFDVHLMLDNPDRHVEAFAEAGADQISIHVEPDYPIDATLERIAELGCRTGLVLNPDTPLEAAEGRLERADIVLLMTVQPGFGGQSFREDVLGKISALARLRDERGLDFRIEVDGGVDSETGPRCVAAGADTLVAGTAFFKAADKTAFISAAVSPAE